MQTQTPKNTQDMQNSSEVKNQETSEASLEEPKDNSALRSLDEQIKKQYENWTEEDEALAEAYGFM